MKTSTQHSNVDRKKQSNNQQRESVCVCVGWGALNLLEEEVWRKGLEHTHTHTAADKQKNRGTGRQINRQTGIETEAERQTDPQT